MKAIVTGAAGFIGCHMCHRLLNMGWEVVGVDNLSRAGSEINLQWLNKASGEWRFERADIRNRCDVDRVLEAHRGADLLLHAAAQVAVTTSIKDPRHDFEVNASGTLNMLEAVRKFSPGVFFIYSSTNKVYGSLESVPLTEHADSYAFPEAVQGISENQTLDFHSPYGCSKGAADQYVRDYSRIYGLKTVVCRQSCIYGTRQFGVEDQGWIAWFLIASLLELPIVVYGNGKQVRDVLWVDDLVDLYLQLYEKQDKLAGQVFNVGGGARNAISINQLLDLIPSLTGNRPALRSADWRAGDQKIFISDISSSLRDIGWEPKVDVEHGLDLLVAWLKENIQIVRTTLHARDGLSHGSRGG